MKKDFLSIHIETLTVIAPDEVALRKIEDALRLIKKTDAVLYQKIFERLQMIFVTNKMGGTNEFFMPEKIWFANKSVILKNDLPWLASLIVHESFHATQFKNGNYILPLGEELEKPAIAHQERFLKKIEGKSGSSALKSAYERKYWEAAYEDTSSFTYFRNLLDLLNDKKLKIVVVKMRKPLYSKKSIKSIK